MNMDGPSDHRHTDIFSFNRPAFGEPTDSLIRDIRRFGGDSLLQDGQPLPQRLWGLWPQQGRVDEGALRQLAADLVPIHDQLRADAQARGWEVQLNRLVRDAQSSARRPDSGMSGFQSVPGKPAN
jgi:hypothetical protein